MVSYKIDSVGYECESLYTDGWFIFHTTTSFPFDKEIKVNVCNEKDQYCFKWALISALLTIVNRPQRCSVYNIDISLEIIRISDEIKLVFTGLTFPLEIKCIYIFFKNEYSYMSLNVF